MYTKSYIGSRIKERRKKLGLTQKELASKINEGIDPDDAPHTQITNWENGSKIPGTESLARLCNALDCDIEYLLGAIDAPHRTTHDVMEQTGLDEDAVTCLQKIRDYQHEELGVRKHGYIIPVLGILSELLKSDQLYQVTNNISLYLLYRELSKKKPDYNAEPLEGLTLEEDKRFRTIIENRGLEIIDRKDIYEMYLQIAAEKFKNLVREISIDV